VLDYSDFFGEGEDVEWIESIWNISEGDDEIVRFANNEISKGNFSWFGNKSLLSFESVLLLYHIFSMDTLGKLSLLLFKDGKLLWI
jgi:hypothetical protein